MLDTADPVRDLREVADAELLLLLHAERAVIGRDDLQVVRAQESPQVRLVVLVLRSQGSGADVLRTFEPRRAEMILEVQVEVLRARLAEHVRAGIACGDDLLDGLARGHVHDVERSARDLGELDGPVGRFLLERDWAREPVEDRVDVAAGERLRDQHVDRGAVLRVHHDHRAVRRRLLHRSQDLAVVAVEDARVGHEELDARDAFLVDEPVHRGERVVVDAADDHVEAVVDRAVAVGLAVPRLEPVEHALTRALHGEVDDRRRAAPRRGSRAGLEGVGRERAAERQLHVGVGVDAAGHDVLAARVDHSLGGRREVAAERARPGLHERRDALAVDQDVHVDGATRRHDGAVGDERGHDVTPPSAGRTCRGGGLDRTATGRAPRRACRGRGRGSTSSSTLSLAASPTSCPRGSTKYVEP